MAFPQWFHDMINAGLADTEEHGQLLPETRLRIYDKIDPMHDNPPNIHAVRGTLAMSAVRQVMPIWESYVPMFEDEPDDDKLPQRLIDRAQTVIDGTANLPDTWTWANDQWHVLTGLAEEIFEFLDDVPNPVAYVPETALKVLLESMGLETLKPMDVKWTEGEQASRYTDDAASAAAIVLCGGGDTEVPIDTDARYQYWYWWLTEALPHAWEQGQE